MTSGNIAIFAGLLIAVMAIGCGKSSASVVAKSNAPPPAKVEHAGMISGVVMFDGQRPELPRLSTAGDAHCQQMHPDGLPDESVVVASSGSVANVIVYLKDAPRSDGSLREPAMIDQVNCQYVPHVVAVQINQLLRVKSSDSVFHNINMMAAINPPMNMSETGPGEQLIQFGLPEILRVRCDVHPWMKAVVGVFDSPYFAVTGSDGKFAINNIPPGVYTLTAWHERFGELTRKVTVGPDGSVQSDFTYGDREKWAEKSRQ
jgi:hypothetical protein